MDDGAHESGVVRLDQSSPHRLFIQGLQSRQRVLCQMVPAVLWVWSAAFWSRLFSWLYGYSSGKLFLDWSGYRAYFFRLRFLRFGSSCILLDRKNGTILGTRTRLHEQPKCSDLSFSLLFHLSFSRIRPQRLSCDQSRYRRPDWNKPVGIFIGRSGHAADASLRHRAAKTEGIEINFDCLDGTDCRIPSLGLTGPRRSKPSPPTPVHRPGKPSVVVTAYTRLLCGIRLAPQHPPVERAFNAGGRPCCLRVGYSFCPESWITSNSPMVWSAILSSPWQDSHRA